MQERKGIIAGVKTECKGGCNLDGAGIAYFNIKRMQRECVPSG